MNHLHVQTTMLYYFDENNIVYFDALQFFTILSDYFTNNLAIINFWGIFFFKENQSIFKFPQ